MKIRWREHEFILIAVLVIITLLGYCYQLGPANIFWPKAGMTLLLFAAYCGVNLLVKVMPRPDMPVASFCLRLLAAACLFLGISFILALGANYATFYARPYEYNYKGFNILSLFGYNDHPMQDLFAGMSNAFGIVAVMLVYCYVRDLLIRRGIKRPHVLQAVNVGSAFLVIFFTIPYVLATFNLIALDGAFRGFYGFLPAVLLYSLCCIYWIFPRATRGWRTALKIVGAAVFSTLLFVFFPARYFEEFKVVFLLCCLFQLVVITPLAWLLYEQYKENLVRIREAQADLQLLRSQINPHFLFNVLNTLYGSALMHGARPTAEGIQQLGDMMRFMLHDNHLDTISMQRELEYLNNYISLQKLRMETSEHVVVEDDIQEAHCNHQIAPMLLIPFVENAFKHGFNQAARSWVKIHLKCDEKNIYFEVRNSIHPEELNDPEKERSGIGLPNVKERLKLLYPGRFQLQDGVAGDEFVVKLHIRP